MKATVVNKLQSFQITPTMPPIHFTLNPHRDWHSRDQILTMELPTLTAVFSDIPPNSVFRNNPTHSMLILVYEMRC